MTQVSASGPSDPPVVYLHEKSVIRNVILKKLDL